MDTADVGCTYDELASAMWGHGVSGTLERIYYHSSKLRAKIQQCTGIEGLIRPRHGRLRFDTRLLRAILVTEPKKSLNASPKRSAPHAE